jgi:hypothetical protein
MQDLRVSAEPRLLDEGRAVASEHRRICCFTTIFKDWDYLKDIPAPFREAGVDYYCFTDDPHLESDSWQVVYVGPVDDGREENRRYKQLWVHPLQQQGYDFFVYLDATLFVRAKLTQLVDILELSRSDLVSLYYAGTRAPWNGLLAMRNTERYTRFAKTWHELMMTEDRRMPDGRVRDEWCYWEALRLCPDLRLNLLPYAALPQYAGTIHHKHLSLSPKLEKRLLADAPLYKLGWLAVPIIFVGGFLFRRHKIEWIKRTFEKATGWI